MGPTPAFTSPRRRTPRTRCVQIGLSPQLALPRHGGRGVVAASADSCVVCASLRCHYGRDVRAGQVAAVLPGWRLVVRPALPGQPPGPAPIVALIWLIPPAWRWYQYPRSYDKADCLERSKGGLGSSQSWKRTSTMGGIMSADCTSNPDFCNYNRVHMAYCDGNSFSGNRTEPVRPMTLG
jgi:hypothetical protein